MHAISDEAAAAVRDALLAFFDAHARPLPWRATLDPYAIWVSEVMAQQTRVETVVPYYERWLRSFPDVHSLAGAAADDVLKAWEGLGYYSRARNLHAAARIICERYAGELPAAYNELRMLPGIGDYTAGAVASIAFARPLPAIDGNARRVLARLLDHPDPPAALLRETMLALIPADRPGAFNQAVMELGATICTPRTPKCGRCPVRELCAAHRAGTQADRPRSKMRKPVRQVEIATAVLRDAEGRMLLVRRPARGLLARLWCFPGEEVTRGGDMPPLVRRIAEHYGSPRGTPVALGTVRHAFTHRRENYHCFAVDLVVNGRGGSDAVWVDAHDWSLALPRAQQRIRRLALDAG